MNAVWETAEVSWPADLPAAVDALAGSDELAWLDTAADLFGPSARPASSMICGRPVAVLEQFDGGPAVFRIGGIVRGQDANGWRLWQKVHARLPGRTPTGLGLSPGWVGYAGFEMARQLERLPATHHEDLGLPLLRLALYDRGIVLDHQRRRALAVRADGDNGIADRDHDPDWLARWQSAAAAHAGFGPVTARLLPGIDQAAHERAVARALQYIAAGDIYQVNLAQRLSFDRIGDPLATYAAVRRANPAAYAALLRWDGGAIASVSPELFLQVRDDQVLTRPIKGTRPRSGDPVRDDEALRELLSSKKEAAELTMIVDLHRNDLGRVCRYGSVRVPHARRVEAHPTVFHTVADVTGRLTPGRDGLDLLAACFPAGSISGVPKIRAIQIIDELEPVARGAYTGAIGVLGLDGRMTFNVAIRTLQICGARATLHVGGGIVADSEPTAEYEETLAKAAGILSGLGVEVEQASQPDQRRESCGIGHV